MPANRCIVSKASGFTLLVSKQSGFAFSVNEAETGKGWSLRLRAGILEARVIFFET